MFSLLSVRSLARTVRFSMRFSGVRVEHDAVHVDARQVDVVGIDRADLDDLLDLDDA